MPFCSPLHPSKTERNPEVEATSKSPSSRVLPAETQPNIAVEPTPNSFRSCVAPAIGRGSPLALGAQSRQKDQTVSLERELPDIRDRNEHIISLGHSAEGVWTHQNTVRHQYVCTSDQGSTRPLDNRSTALRTTGTPGCGRACSCRRW